MYFVPVRDLRIRPGDVWRQLEQHGDLVLTSNGRPIAVVLGVADGEDVESTLRSVRRARAQATVSDMRAAAADHDAAGMTDADIQHEIKAVRRGRRK